MKPILVSNNEDLLDRLVGRNPIKLKDDGINIVDPRGDPKSILGADVCITYGIETMQDLMDFMESVADEEVFYDRLEEEDASVAYTLTPVSGYVNQEFRKIKASFYCKLEEAFHAVNLCYPCAWFEGLDKETLILSCSCSV